jgi:hypothetical protein
MTSPNAQLSVVQVNTDGSIMLALSFTRDTVSETHYIPMGAVEAVDFHDAFSQAINQTERVLDATGNRSPHNP